MRNKPKYNFFKNTRYAIEGFFCIFKTEKSFRIELIFTILLVILLILIDLSKVEKLILFITYFLILIVEILNSAIENTVDLCTNDIVLLAKNAKDIGALAVMFSIVLHIICWILVLTL
ncbi:diacylglycerol kinase [Aliarcobacter butzleri]|uniref:diacylglycerol kinase n=1 Tax=Aliarcobacter butzleri TaxID=28197 RepID=UPI0021B382B2|nr:diacylglycerol kinase [Aliarcobacter butzleri]MCT7554550.1 diacylglycerol kinase [Aliarcobacter butzleri]